MYDPFADENNWPSKRSNPAPKPPTTPVTPEDPFANPVDELRSGEDQERVQSTSPVEPPREDPFSDPPEAPEPAPEPVTTTASRANRPQQRVQSKPRPAKAPEDKVRRPSSQNEHLWCIVNLQKQLSPSEAEIAFTLHALCYVNGGDRDATNEYLAYKTGLTDKTVKTAVKRLLAIGLFDRLDNGKGGRGGKGKARYRAAVPSWYTQERG